ncbi:ATP-dependent helicase [Leptospira langatensis]|uniref:DNA 3'-5' helicase n=1 Tax=Leptospira langatensis TaxID=2484983 RepID=A0A5F1ZXH3_9LEPT|nr:ATP-dependent helicase [Leptospira langatensis]TGK04141.1 ATP-dependent helicase [Leptospira langatensis]TGL43621.1 ATP-dependent helicase [Leptospira langatensis]
MGNPEILNEKQKEAIETLNGPVLVIAGAGTGKTKTLVHRLSKLVETGVPAENILLLTFTRKASREMLSRAVSLLDKRCARVHGGTFHSFSSHVLRKYAPVLGLSSQFSVLDESDTADIFQLLRTEGEYSKQKSRFPSNDTLISLHSASINRVKTLEELLKTEYPKFLEQETLIQKIFLEYATYKKERSLIDYDDLLVHTRDLLNKHESVRKKLAEQYQYIMVDEYQDTNQIQAHIACLLALDHENIFVVGDDAQSVYSFRGADVNGIFNFPKIFPKTKTIYLERNYRSTPSILNLANSVLANFKDKYEKYLYTKNDDYLKPDLIGYPDELEEAEGIADMILERREDGIPLKDIAVLFRSGWNSNQLELVLSQRNIPFLKFGGKKFIDSAHAKDYLSLLKVRENRMDSLSWLRVLLLLPGIGIAKGKAILTELEKTSGNLDSVLQFSSGPSSSYLKELVSLLQAPEGNLQKLLGDFIHFYSPLLEKKYDDSKRRLEDLNSFLTLSQRYDGLHEFLVDMSLEGPTKSLDKLSPEEEEERLILSTVHSSKGLEFDTVVLLNISEGSFPSGRGEKNLEEERRLFYVAITRAKKKLVLTYPQISFQNNSQYFNRVSRFIEEISEPEKVLNRGFVEKQKEDSAPSSQAKTEQETDARKRIREFFGS